MKVWKVIDLYGSNEDLEWQLNNLEADGAVIKEIICLEKFNYQIIYTEEASKGKDALHAMDWGCTVAMVFGSTSPNKMMMMVMTTVAAPTPPCPKRDTAKAVAAEEAKLFTKLFPIKIVVKSPSISDFKVATRRAPVILSFIICRSCTLEIDRRAVSEEEKKAEAATKATKRIAVRIMVMGPLFLCGWF